VLKLQAHFNQANEDVRQIVISAEKAEKRGGRIAEVEFAEDPADTLPVPPVHRLQAGE
jgi:DNA recombination protein RmuC